MEQQQKQQRQQAVASAAPSAHRIVVRRVSASGPAHDRHMQHFRAMTAAYLEWLGEDLGFQGVQRELASLPGSYAAGRGGAMLLAFEVGGDDQDHLGGSSGAGSSSGAGGSSGSSDPGSSGSEEDAAAAVAAVQVPDSGSGASGAGGERCVGAVALRGLAGHTPMLGPGDALAGVPLEAVCEMKRLFVLPGHHGRGAGAALVRALLAEAAALGYHLMVLDTLDRLQGGGRGELLAPPCTCHPGLRPSVASMQMPCPAMPLPRTRARRRRQPPVLAAGLPPLRALQ